MDLSLTQLPKDVFCLILSFLTVREVTNFRKISKLCKQFADDPDVWRPRVLAADSQADKQVEKDDWRLYYMTYALKAETDVENCIKLQLHELSKTYELRIPKAITVDLLIEKLKEKLKISEPIVALRKLRSDPWGTTEVYSVEELVDGDTVALKRLWEALENGLYTCRLPEYLQEAIRKRLNDRDTKSCLLLCSYLPFNNPKELREVAKENGWLPAGFFDRLGHKITKVLQSRSSPSSPGASIATHLPPSGSESERYGSPTPLFALTVEFDSLLAPEARTLGKNDELSLSNLAHRIGEYTRKGRYITKWTLGIASLPGLNAVREALKKKKVFNHCIVIYATTEAKECRNIANLLFNEFSSHETFSKTESDMDPEAKIQSPCYVYIARKYHFPAF